jgi:hypothetical protein
MAAVLIGSDLGMGTSAAIGAGLKGSRDARFRGPARRRSGRATRGESRGQPRAQALPDAKARLRQIVVEMRGLEPLTPAMRTRCSSS